MFVLSYVLPPEEGAAFGKATVFEPVPYLARAAKTQTVQVLTQAGVPRDEARKFGLSLTLTPTGEHLTHKGTGLVFRIDPADNPPNVCPCCGRLVKPGDHASAGDPDAYCLGCFTWQRNVPACLPENSAHTEEI